jgi:16S rRNA (cytosine967-C5)-methyltransferase
MRSHSYINSAKNILQEYDGSMPFAIWLKQFFKAHKKYGSKDRREITHLCYSYFRLGKAFENKTVEERILSAVFLCSAESNFVLGELKPGWNEEISLSLHEKIHLLHAEEEIKHLFSFADELSEVIDTELFHRSFLIQPLLYLRIRPGKKNKVADKLQKAGIDFEIVNNDCFALANSSKIDEVIELNTEAVVQDLNSQRVLELLPEEIKNRKKTEAWDCCAASGGKSILLHDQFPQTHITVSDVRETILFNLKKRFEQAGIRNYKSFVADLSASNYKPQTANFDLIICDAPCSGSGTWARTPEQLHFFKKEKIEYYAQLQKSIALNAAKSVKEKGYFLYITCSVFKKENEEVMAFIRENTTLQPVASQYFIGYDKKADTLFAALFENRG